MLFSTMLGLLHYSISLDSYSLPFFSIFVPATMGQMCPNVIGLEDAVQPHQFVQTFITAFELSIEWPVLHNTTADEVDTTYASYVVVGCYQRGSYTPMTATEG